jgi:hypothetical protein
MRQHYDVIERGTEKVKISELTKFKLISGNRPVYITEKGEQKRATTLDISKIPGAKWDRSGRIGKIIRAIYDKDTRTWNQKEPIVVNIVTNTIGNGQGRTIAALCKLADGGLDPDTTVTVRYVEVPEEYEVDWVSEINSQQSNWSQTDKVESFIALGNENYILLDQWARTQPICMGQGGRPNYRTAAAILAGGRQEHNLNNGEYIFPKENVLFANILCSEMQAIINAIPAWTKGKANIEAMVKEWKNFREMFDFGDWLYGISTFGRGPEGMGILSATTWKEWFTTVAGTLSVKYGIMPKVKEVKSKSTKRMGSVKKAAAAAGISI